MSQWKSMDYDGIQKGKEYLLQGKIKIKVIKKSRKKGIEIERLEDQPYGLKKGDRQIVHPDWLSELKS